LNFEPFFKVQGSQTGLYHQAVTPGVGSDFSELEQEPEPDFIFFKNQIQNQSQDSYDFVELEVLHKSKEPTNTGLKQTQFQIFGRTKPDRCHNLQKARSHTQ
jgi:hypothetical protein